jgi:NAD(P)-dependent dehydrogenase (short-subunit alcohol dehydrogenase family)
MDLRDAARVKNTASQIFSGQQHVSLVVFCAGGFGMDDFSSTDEKALEEMIQKNFVTAFNPGLEIFRHLRQRQQGAKMIFIGSKQSIHPAAGTEAISYTLSKSLLLPFVHMCNTAGKAFDLTAHVLAPSIIDTKSNREAMPDADFDRWVKPAVLADVMLFLAGSSGQQINQEIVEVFNQS